MTEFLEAKRKSILSELGDHVRSERDALPSPDEIRAAISVLQSFLSSRDAQARSSSAARTSTSVLAFMLEHAQVTTLSDPVRGEIQLMSVPPQAIQAAITIIGKLLEWQNEKQKNAQLEHISDQLNYLSAVCEQILEELREFKAYVNEALRNQFLNALDNKIRRSASQFHAICAGFATHDKPTDADIEILDTIRKDAWDGGLEVVPYGVPAYPPAIISLSIVLGTADLLKNTKSGWSKGTLEAIVQEYERYFQRICLDENFEGSLTNLAKKNEGVLNQRITYLAEFPRDERLLGFQLTNASFGNGHGFGGTWSSFYATVSGDFEHVPFECKVSAILPSDVNQLEPNNRKKNRFPDQGFALGVSGEMGARELAMRIAQQLNNLKNEGHEARRRMIELTAVAMGISDFIMKAKKFVADYPPIP